MKTKLILNAALITAFSVPLQANAEVFGGFPGRTVNAQENNGTAVEAFYKSFEGSAPGVRLSHRYSDDILLFADFLQFTLETDDIGIADDAEGNAFGAGLMYFQPELVDGYDAAILVSYHTSDLSTDAARFVVPGTTAGLDGVKFNTDASEIAVQLIISSREPLSSNGLQWYAGAGVHRLNLDADLKAPSGGDVLFSNANTSINISEQIRASEAETEFGATAGVVLPTSFGHVYAAVESIDDTILGVGARYNLK